MTRTPTKEALAFHARLYGLVQALPGFQDDRPGYDAGIARIKAAIVEAGGAVRNDWNGARVRVHGFSATSTTGVAGACRNWMTQVTLKAAEATMGSLT
jgi:hypothetical protein